MNKTATINKVHFVSRFSTYNS